MAEGEAFWGHVKRVWSGSWKGIELLTNLGETFTTYILYTDRCGAVVLAEESDFSSAASMDIYIDDRSSAVAHWQ